MRTTGRFKAGPAVILSAACLLFLDCAPARADLIFSIGSALVGPGGTGNFDITLQNTGPAAVDIALFNVQISTSNTYLSFDDATIDTTDFYIFDGNSAFADQDTDSLGPIITTGPATLSVNDEQGSLFVDPPTWTSLASGATVGLANITFDIDPAATYGTFQIAFDSWDLGTSISDPLGTDLTPANTPANFVNGSVTIAPEPSSAVLIAVGAGLVWSRRRRAAVK